jgi:hypothetical protein
MFLWSSAQVEKGFYGFPSLDGLSVKVATEQFTSLSGAEDGSVAVTPEQAQGFYDGYVACERDRVEQPMFTEGHSSLYGGSRPSFCYRSRC